MQSCPRATNSIHRQLIQCQTTSFSFFITQLNSTCIDYGLEPEIQSVRKRYFKDIDAKQFLLAYIYVVLNSGMNNQVAEGIYINFLKTLDNNLIGHPGKRKAVETAPRDCIYSQWYTQLTVLNNRLQYLNGTVDDIVNYLQELPYIGGITCYHLARNIGFDVAKPDRILVRLAKKYDFNSAHDICETLSKATGEHVGTVDVIL